MDRKRVILLIRERPLARAENRKGHSMAVERISGFQGEFYSNRLINGCVLPFIISNSGVHPVQIIYQTDHGLLRV